MLPFAYFDGHQCHKYALTVASVDPEYLRPGSGGTKRQSMRARCYLTPRIEGLNPRPREGETLRDVDAFDCSSETRLLATWKQVINLPESEESMDKRDFNNIR
jgi:hypothetical protein